MIRIAPPSRLFHICSSWTLPLSALCSACSSPDQSPSVELAGRRSEPLDSRSVAESELEPSDPTRTDEREEPSGGAPHYLHFGPNGLCTNHGIDAHVPEAGGIVFYEDIGLLVIKQGSAWRSELRLFVDTKGTRDWYDDTVEIELHQAYEGVAGPPTVISESFPYYAPPSGGIGGWTTSTEPKTLTVLKAEFTSSDEDEDHVASVVNDTRIPMRAYGHFGRPWEGAADGFLGGSGPDCVLGWNYDDVILGRGGADFLRGLYGNDFLAGGAENDTLQGRGDDDVMDGGDGIDRLEDGSGEDCFRGGKDGLRDVLIANTSFVSDYPVYEMEPGVIDGVPVDNIEHLITDDGNGFSGVTVCP